MTRVVTVYDELDELIGVAKAKKFTIVIEASFQDIDIYTDDENYKIEIGSEAIIKALFQELGIKIKTSDTRVRFR